VANGRSVENESVVVVVDGCTGLGCADRKETLLGFRHLQRSGLVQQACLLAVRTTLWRSDLRWSDYVPRNTARDPETCRGSWRGCMLRTVSLDLAADT